MVAVVVLTAGIASLVVWNQRSSAAESAMDAAMDVYVAPLAQPGAPAEKGVYTTAADRSKAALTFATHHGKRVRSSRYGLNSLRRRSAS